MTHSISLAAYSQDIDRGLFLCKMLTAALEANGYNHSAEKDTSQLTIADFGITHGEIDTWDYVFYFDMESDDYTRYTLKTQ